MTNISKRRISVDNRSTCCDCRNGPFLFLSAHLLPPPSLHSLLSPLFSVLLLLLLTTGAFALRRTDTKPCLLLAAPRLRYAKEAAGKTKGISPAASSCSLVPSSSFEMLSLLSLTLFSVSRLFLSLTMHLGAAACTAWPTCHVERTLWFGKRALDLHQSCSPLSSPPCLFPCVSLHRGLPFSLPLL